MTHQNKTPAPGATATGAEVNTLAGAYILTAETRLIHFAEVQSARDAAPRPVSMAWSELAALLTTHREGPKDGPGFTPCARTVASRTKGSATHADLLVLDVDGPEGKPKPGASTPFADAVATLTLTPWHFAAHTTHSHQQATLEKAAGERYRVIVPLAEPLRDLRLLPLYGQALVEALDIAAADVDRCSFEPERLMYYPRHNEGAPFNTASGGREFMPLAWLVPDEVAADELARLEAQECAAERANTHKANTTGARNQTPPQHATGAISPIDEFNRCYDTAAILEKHGYRHQSSRNGHDLYLYPGSATGVAGVWLFRDTGNVISFHSGDPLATRGPDGNPTAHDAFDCWALLEHGGDRSAALKAAGAMLTTTDHQTGQEVTITQMNQRNHARAQDEAQTLAALPWMAGGGGRAWPEPQPLIARTTGDAYPVDALPLKVRAAVEEVAAFSKAPLAMVAASALSALSLAIEAYFDVKRGERLQGPVGLFLLTIAESGERKSTVDGYFGEALRNYEREQEEAARPLFKAYNADHEAWEAKRAGIKDKLRSLAKEGKPTEKDEAALRLLQSNEPKAPRVPRLLYADVTPEALAYGLATRWPAGGIVSAEAGIVFGSHGMGSDSVMRNLATLNQLWDGKEITIDRRTSESFSVTGARLTVALQVQEDTLREFFGKSGRLARGTGFLARFLVAWPESTQGWREYVEPPESTPALTRFTNRLAAVLAQTPAMTEEGALTPVVLPLSPEAKEAWIQYHNDVERELRPHGELCDVKDVASKSADNAARLAALFHVFEHGGGAVSLANFEAASRIAAWYLNESRRFFGEIAMPVEMGDAVRVDAYLLSYCQRFDVQVVARRQLQQLGPVRDGAHLDRALAELEEVGRVRQRKVGRRIEIEINPALTGGGR